MATGGSSAELKPLGPHGPRARARAGCPGRAKDGLRAAVVVEKFFRRRRRRRRRRRLADYLWITLWITLYMHIICIYMHI